MAQAQLIYGLVFTSDRPLPARLALPSDQVIPITVRFVERFPWADELTVEVSPLATLRSVDHTILRRLTRVTSAAGEWFHVETHCPVSFAFSPTGSDAHCVAPPGTDRGLLESMAIGPLFSFLVWLRGGQALHASAVVVDGQAIAFCGTSGAGKSTTAAQFVRLGHRLLTDDVLAWRWEGETCHAHAGPTRVKLWPDSAAVVQSGTVGDLPRVYGQVEKRILDLPDDGGLGDEGYPLSCIHILTPGAESARDLSATEAFVALKEHCRDDSILPRELRARQFMELARLARTVRVRRVPAHSGLDQLDAFYRSLIADLRNGGPTPMSPASC
jgi:hypothetical protein